MVERPNKSSLSSPFPGAYIPPDLHVLFRKPAEFMSCVLRLRRDGELLTEAKSMGFDVCVPRSCKNSGCINITVSEAGFSDLEGQIRDSIAFLRTHESALKSLRAAGSLDVGIEARDVAAQTDHFPVELLQLLAGLALGLDLSVYQVSRPLTT